MKTVPSDSDIRTPRDKRIEWLAWGAFWTLLLACPVLLALDVFIPGFFAGIGAAVIYILWGDFRQRIVDRYVAMRAARKDQ
ncbi:MAG: hypothetical protein R2725_07675 [Solirubrobacterales bacterium]